MIRKLILGALAACLLTSLNAANLSEIPSDVDASQPKDNVTMADVSTGSYGLPAVASSRAAAGHIVSAPVAPCNVASYSASPLHSTATVQRKSGGGGCAVETSASSRVMVSSSVTQSSCSASLPSALRKTASGTKVATTVSSSADFGKRTSNQVGNVSLPQSSFTSTSVLISDKDEPALSRVGDALTPVRRVDWGDGEHNGGGLKEPNPDPVGELPFCFMALLLMAFVLYRRHALSRE